MRGYISKIRSKIGTARLIHPAARIIIENEKGEILFVYKTDGNLALPAGGFEEGETISECIKREVKEEAGIEILEMEVIGISTDPQNETVVYANGDVVQYFTIEFYSRKWEGELKVMDTNEVVKAVFKDKIYLDEIPDSEKSIIDSLTFFRATGRIMVK